jgi:NAD(P)-dependent dehydrogenase (short-subunit alcohol dehydrogenase family)
MATLDDRPVAIVTAASAGIGAACARELTRRGYRLSLLARSEAVEALAEEIGALATRGSVTDPDALHRLVDTTVQTLGRIDAVVVNTGHPPKGELLSISDVEWHTGLDLLLLPVVRMARFVTPIFERQGGGVIVSLSSIAAQEANLDRPVSSAVRAALSSFARLYADRYAKSNIRINTVLSGWVDTHPVAESDVAAIPMGRSAKAEEIARVVSFLVSADSSYVTGENLRVDGGLLRGF